jgi:hypothetical protein
MAMRRGVRKDRPAAKEIRRAVEAAIGAMAAPAAIESGEAPLALTQGSFRLEEQNGRLWLECWSEDRNLARRITAIREQSRRKLVLRVACFGGREADLVVADLASPDAARVERSAARKQFRETLRRFLSRQFPGWQLRSISTEADLEHSLSPLYARALLVKGGTALAAIGTGETEGDPAGVLTAGLIWLDYLRKRNLGLTLKEMAVFVPEGFEKTVCLRVRWLDPDRASYRVWVHRNQREELLDPFDYGNVDTRLGRYRDPRAETAPELLKMVDCVARLPFVQRVDAGDGWLSLRVDGLEFARAGRAGLFIGLDQREIAEHRRADARGGNPLSRRSPEARLESQVRTALRTVDATLSESPVYGQLPAFAAAERGVLDLLAIDCTGRLVVIELKASEDPHLPLQALDYWLRVQWHLERGEFEHAGYFPGRKLRRDPPRLLLVAPALQFHPSNQQVLSFLSPQVEVEQVGVGLEWQKSLRVVARWRRPCPCP